MTSIIAALAKQWGWRRHDVLALPQSERKRLLDRLEEQQRAEAKASRGR